MNERTRFFIKNIISHTLFSKGWCSVCVWEMGCSTVGHWGPQALSQQADSHAGIISPTDSNRLCSGYIIVLRPPTSAVLPLIFTDASLGWRLSRGSIYNNIQGHHFCGRVRGYYFSAGDTISVFLFPLVANEWNFGIKLPMRSWYAVKNQRN